MHRRAFTVRPTVVVVVVVVAAAAAAAAAAGVVVVVVVVIVQCCCCLALLLLHAVHRLIGANLFFACVRTSCPFHVGLVQVIGCDMDSRTVFDSEVVIVKTCMS